MLHDREMQVVQYLFHSVLLLMMLKELASTSSSSKAVACDFLQSRLEGPAECSDSTWYRNQWLTGAGTQVSSQQ
jgi:hypothetical protein